MTTGIMPETRKLLERVISIIESDKAVAEREAKESAAFLGSEAFANGRAVAYGRVLTLLNLELTGAPSKFAWARESKPQMTKRR